MAITTVAEYKAYANITDTSLDTPLAVWLGRAIARAKTYTGLDFEKQGDTGAGQTAYSEYVNGTDENSITLKQAPIISVTSLQLVDTEQAVTATYDAADYYVDPDCLGVIRLHPAGPAVRHSYGIDTAFSSARWKPCGFFPRGHGNVKFTGVVGYETVPEDVKGAVWDLVAVYAAQAGMSPALASIGLGDASASFRDPKASAEAILSSLDSWRRL